MVLKASVASMTSKDMIKSLASMTSTASLVSKSQKLLAGWIPCHQEPQQPQWPQQPQQPQWPQWPQQPHFIKNITELDVSINPDTKMTFSGLLMFDGSLKIHYFIDFWHLFFWRLWRTGMLLLTKSKGHTSNFHYSGFPNHLQTKSNLHISIRQSQILCVKT